MQLFRVNGRGSLRLQLKRGESSLTSISSVGDVSLLKGLYQLNKADVGKTTKLLIDSFGQDAFFKHLFTGVKRRDQALSVIYSTIAGLYIAKGWAYATSASLEGVMLTRRTDAGFGFWDSLRMLRMLKVLLYVNLIKTIHRARHFAVIWKGLEFYFKRYKGYFLDMVAVSPAFREKGFMSRMIRSLLESTDKAGTFCLLETENPNNVPIYEHFGFKRIKSGTVQPVNVPFFYMAYDPAGILDSAKG
jgi:GNAT superfamily N-acetyltransferase